MENTKKQSKSSAPVDLVHLSRQTLGDRSLEAEILSLFMNQSSLYMDRLRNATTWDERKLASHTILGSARGIGAWAVAQEAELVQANLATTSDLSALQDAVDQATGYISGLLD